MKTQLRQRIIRLYPHLFDAAVDRVLNSPNPDDRRWLLLGFTDDGHHAVVVPRDVLLKHGHVIGDPGSGKTARCLSPLITQLIASGEVSVVILDLKGDLALFHNAREEAERAGLPFRWFTNRIGWSSCAWNPFSEPFLAQMSESQRSQSLLAALGIPLGEAYGPGFFSATQRLVLKKILQRYAASIHSFADLLRYVGDANAYKGLGPKTDWDNARHMVSILEMLADLLLLNVTAADVPAGSSVLTNAISVDEVLTRPTVVYFALPSTVDANQATCIARIFLYSLMNAASIYQPDRRTVDTFTIVDEAQLIATQGLPQILNTCRSLRLGVILAHQSLDQLKLGSDLDLTQVVMSSTTFKQVFRASDLLIRDYLTKTSGEAMYELLSWQQPMRIDEWDIACWAALSSTSGVGWPAINVQEQIRPRLEPNRLMEISAHPALSLVNFTADEGPVQYQGAWTPTISGFHIDAETYRRRMQTPWPAASDAGGTLVVPREWQPGQSLARSSSPPVSPPLKPSGDLQERIREAQERMRRLKGDQL